MNIPPETPETIVPAPPPADREEGATVDGPRPATPNDGPVAVPPTSVPAAGRYAHPLELGTMAVIVTVDQLSKAIVRQVLPLGESRSIIPEFLDLTHVHNTGAAFGLLNAADFPYKPMVMIAIAAVALVAIAAYATQLGFHERMARFGLALILGGAFGNLIDRATAGYVVDFVDVYWGTTHFWAFNVADSAITIGAILVLLDMIGIGRRHASHPV
jgi:signal peptidase II